MKFVEILNRLFTPPLAIWTFQPPRGWTRLHLIAFVGYRLPSDSALIPFCNVPPPRGQVRLHLAAFVGYRLPSQSVLIPSYNVPPPRGWARLHLAAFVGYRLPSQTNTNLFCEFFLTSTHLGRTSRSITYP